jgi:hypothetical protein
MELDSEQTTLRLVDSWWRPFALAGIFAAIAFGPLVLLDFANFVSPNRIDYLYPGLGMAWMMPAIVFSVAAVLTVIGGITWLLTQSLRRPEDSQHLTLSLLDEGGPPSPDHDSAT